MTKLIPFAKYMSEDDIRQMKENTVKRTYKAGTHIHGGDADCLGILLITKGTTRTYMMSEEGREITLFRMKEGEWCVLSASCIMPAITFDVFIDAETDVELLQINASWFQEFQNRNVHAENFVYKIAIEKFSEVMWVMEQVMFMKMDKRLAIFLLDEGPTISMTHDEIARHMGSAREVISRMLKYFSAEGYVSLSRGTIHVEDRNALMQFL